MDITTQRPKVVIIGSGFAGLEAAKHLTDCPADVVLIDKRNHHVFQPLLYQVATAALSPAQIAQPIRSIVKKQKNCTVVLGEIINIDPDKKIVYGHKGNLSYDYLVVATGATHTYFGHDKWAPFAPGLKSLNDALHIRQRILAAFEKAEICEDEQERKSLMTFVLIGGGPTGVEMAGAIAELARHTLKNEFRLIDPANAHVILIEAGPRPLAAFPEKLSDHARKDLEQIGVDVMTGVSVTDCTKDGVQAGDNFIPCRTIVWTAGVRASPAAVWLKAEQDKAGRVIVAPDLSLPQYPDIFVIGDTAHVTDAKGRNVPGLAPAAAQEGKYAAQLIASKIESSAPPPPFMYRDCGIMATIGREKAVAKIRNFTFGGFFAWCLWGSIHLIPLVGFRNRLGVAVDWTWAYFTRSRGVRLITSGSESEADI